MRKLICVCFCVISLEKEFSFKVQGSYEGTQDIVLGSNLVFSSSSPAKFHYARYKQPMLDVTLPGKKPPSSSVCYKSALKNIIMACKILDTINGNINLHCGQKVTFLTI